MGKTKKRAGFFLPLEPRWNTKYQKFVKSKDIRKLPSKKYPQHNQKSCCIWSALKEKQPALFFPGVWQVCSFPTAACCCRVYFFSPMAAKGWAHPESRCPVPGADVLVLGKQRCWHCPCQPTSLRAPSRYAQPHRRTQHPRVFYASAEMLVNSHAEMVSLHTLEQF